jgi:outer membrane receptor protein involved in Fe transport
LDSATPILGERGGNAVFLIDGMPNRDEVNGGAAAQFNQDSILEFQVLTGSYKAEFGHGSGGVINVVSKSGTNDFSGAAYGYFRDTKLNTRTETEKQAGVAKQDYKRKQYGFAFGGPLVKDKAHFFATYEKTKRDTNYAVDTGGLFPTFDGTIVPTPFDDQMITAKATYDINTKHYLQVRYGYQKNSDKYGASPLASPDALGTVDNKYSSILAGYTAQIGDDKFNELVFQYTKFDNLISADSNDPQIYYPSGFHTGENLNTPQSTHQVKYQYKDDFSFTKTIAGDSHDFKIGFAHVNEPTLGGDFSTGLAGQYYALEDSLTSPIQYIEKYGGFFGDKTPNKQYSVYFQDDWQVNPDFTLNVGIRYDYFDCYEFLDQSSNPIWQTLHTQRTYTEGYLKDFWDADGRLKNDRNNIAPRFGFSWDVKGDGRHVLRGGFGRFYDFPYSNATVLFPASTVQSDYGLIYSNYNEAGIRNPDGTFFRPGQPLPPNQGGAPLGASEVASPTLATPYSDQISLGYSWRATDWLGINIEAVSSKYEDIPFRFRPNIGVDANHNHVFEPGAGEQYRFPQFGSFRIWYGKGHAKYQGLNIGFRVRQEKFELQGFYTLSKAEGNVLAGADDFRLTPGESQADIGGTRLRRDQTVDPLNPDCKKCTGPLYTDARHRISFGFIYNAPWEIKVGGMLRYRSALPYLEHANADLNGDESIIDLPANVKSVNTGRGFSFTQLDLRVSKDFMLQGNFGIEVLAEVFNVLNEKNAARPNRLGVASAYAGDPGQGEQRLAQLGLRIHF